MQRQNKELQAQISAKDFEIEAFKTAGAGAGGGGDGGGAEVAHKIVELKEEMEKERQNRQVFRAEQEYLVWETGGRRGAGLCGVCMVCGACVLRSRFVM